MSKRFTDCGVVSTNNATVEVYVEHDNDNHAVIIDVENNAGDMIIVRLSAEQAAELSDAFSRAATWARYCGS